MFDLYQGCAVPVSEIISESCLFPKYLRNQMRAGIPLWEHWPACNDVSAVQCLRLFWRRSAYIGDLDVASSEHCSCQGTWNLCPVAIQSLSHVRLFVTPWTAARQAPQPSPSPWACSNSCPPSQWCIQSSHPLSPPSPPVLNLSQHRGLF